jgi:hypothetical protein
MSIGDKVWLVTVTTEPAEETEGNPSLTGYFLHASREGAADGLRSALAECGVDELIPELFETEFEEDGTYHGSFTQHSLHDAEWSYDSAYFNTEKLIRTA